MQLCKCIVLGHQKFKRGRERYRSLYIRRKVLLFRERGEEREANYANFVFGMVFGGNRNHSLADVIFSGLIKIIFPYINKKIYTSMSFSKDLLKLSPKVARALQQNKPVVSLQSTIISHGMPYPNNKICALQVQQILRQKGVEPATVAIMNHKIHVGLTEQQIQILAKNGSQARKVSRRDIPFVLAQGGMGATTVAGTMVCSALAGIDIFVTGGLGGVHRGYEETMDVSADLRELGRTPVTVVSAGVKNILDIPRTLQYLETQGVPIVTYGSKYFPAFFQPSSGIQSPMSMDNLQNIAEVLLMRKQLNLQNGILVAVPNNDTQNSEKISKAIQTALKQAQQQQIRGAAATPFLLKRVHSITEGASVKTNIALVKHNAQIGAELALQYYKKLKNARGNGNSFGFCTSKPKTKQYTGQGKRKLIVIGGCAIDYEINVQGKVHLYQSCRGKWRTSFGGVGRNISQTAARLGTQTVFITALGSDQPSNQISRNIQSHGVHLKQIKSTQLKAPTYLSILDDKKDSMICVSDMDINSQLTLANIKQVFFNEEVQKGVNTNDIVVIDANIETTNKNLVAILEYLNQLGYFVIYECKGRKSSNLVEDKAYQYVSLLKMNQSEAQLVIQSVRAQGEKIEQGEEYAWFAKNVGSKAKNTKQNDINFIITRGAKDLQVFSKSSESKIYKIIESSKVKKTTGAGDTLTGTLCSLLLRGQSLEKALNYGIVAGKMTVESAGKDSVICHDLTWQTLQRQYGSSRSQFTV